MSRALVPGRAHATRQRRGQLAVPTLAPSQPIVILLLFASHTLNNAVHNAAWFIVCELEGGVSTGLLMGVKVAL